MAKLWHALDVKETLEELKSNEKGLDQMEAQQRLSTYGPNEIKKEKGKSPLKLLLGQFSNILMIILLFAIALSFAVGEATDAIIILAIVIASAVLGFTQEYRSEKAVEALKRMTSPSANVFRDGKEIKIPASQLVPGDIILLCTGDKIPADARLLETFTMKTDEAALTGESAPVEKTTLKLSEADSAKRQTQHGFHWYSRRIRKGQSSCHQYRHDHRIWQNRRDGSSCASQRKRRWRKRMGSVGKWIGILAVVVAISVGVVGIVVENRPVIDMVLWAIQPSCCRCS